MSALADKRPAVRWHSVMRLIVGRLPVGGDLCLVAVGQRLPFTLMADLWKKLDARREDLSTHWTMVLR